MIRRITQRLARTVAGLLIFSIGSMFVLGFTALGIASYLLAVPLVAGSPMRRRVKVTLNLVTAVMQFIQAMPSPEMLADAMRMATTATAATQEEAPNS